MGVVCLLSFFGKAHSQIMDSNVQVDTLKFAERLSVRSNAVDWFLLTPNIGVEYDLRRYNWSRWALGVNIRGNWQTKHTFKPGVVYNMSEAKVEFRNYWRTRQVVDEISDREVYVSSRPDKEHHKFVDRLFSMRRKRIKHPTTTYYRGLYASYGKYSLKLGHEGKEGTALSAGITYGIVRPLIVYENGNSIDFEAGVSGGLVYTNYNTYVHNRTNDCYQYTGAKDWHIVPYPVVTEVKVGFVYRFGSYPVTKKYRWRYDVDIAYHDTVNNRYSRQSKEKLDRRTQAKADSVYKVFRRDSIKIEKIKADYADSVRKDSAHKAKLMLKRERELKDSLRHDSIASAKRLKKELKKADKLRRKEEKKMRKAQTRAEKLVFVIDERRRNHA